jgi:monoamine oxidase
LANKWNTIKGGLSRMPEAFAPIVKGRIEFNAKVHAIKYNETGKTLAVSHRESGRNPRDVKSTTETFDYVFNSVPFNLLKFWELPPHSSLMRRAIDRTVFGGAVPPRWPFSTRLASGNISSAQSWAAVDESIVR